MAQGWISIHRQLQEHWLWEDKPFSRGQAWIDMLLLANHADKTFMLGTELVEVKSGSFITSELKLMERWGWSKTKVRSFLDVLQKDKMIIKKTDRKKTTITIENYSVFQDSKTTERPQKKHKKTTERPQKNTNNNDNNVNNDNNYNIIVEYLNQKTGSRFQTSKQTKSLIDARLKDGFSIDDFKAVIDKKCDDWIGNPKMEEYLRPITLFGTKFESYLNAKVIKQKPKSTGMPEGVHDPLDDLIL